MRLSYVAFRAMGSLATLQLETGEDGMELLNEALRQVEALEACLSRFRPDSDLMRLNAQAGKWVEVKPLLFEVIRAAKQAALVTNGLYHPLLLDVMLGIGYDRSFEDIETTLKPSRTSRMADWHDIEISLSRHEVRLPPSGGLDLGGIGKGWSADYLADQLSTHGACLVNLGGDIAARGAPKGYSGWPVLVKDSHDSSLIVSLNLSNLSIATSGIDYRRWKNADGTVQHHLINPRTGQPAQTDIQTVTVIHPSGSSAEAFAKAVLIQGSQAGLTWLATQWDSAGMVVKTNGEVIATPNFTQYINPSESKETLS